MNKRSFELDNSDEDDHEGDSKNAERESLLQERIRIDSEIKKLQTKKVLSIFREDSSDSGDQVEDIKKLIRSSYDFDRDFNFEDMIGPGPEAQIDLNEIKRSIEDLKPIYMNRVNENRQQVLFLRIDKNPDDKRFNSNTISSLSLTQFLLTLSKYVRKIDTSDGNNLQKGNSSNDLINQFTSTDNITDDADPTNEEELKALFTSRVGTQVLRRQLSKTNFNISTSRGIREIQYHDLRHLENQFNIHEQPQIMVRRHCVMFSINPVKAIVTADNLYLIAPQGAEVVLQETYDHIINLLATENSTANFEIQAYKAVLSTICSLHFMEHSNIVAQTDNFIISLNEARKMTMNIDYKYQEQIRIIKIAVSSLMVKVNGYKRLFTELMTSVEDISLMNLTLLKQKPILFNKPLSFEILNDNTECLILLETFLVEYHTLETKLYHLQSVADSADELMSFRLDTSRNEFLVVEMILGIVIVSILCGTFIAGLFGMNLSNGIDDNFGPSPFWILVGCLTLFVILSATLLYLWYRKTGTFSIHEELRYDDWEAEYK
jgi:hypothetical protein